MMKNGYTYLNNDKIEIKNNIEEYFKSINKGGLDWQFFKNNEKERDLFFKKVNSGKSSKFIAESFMIRAFQINKSEFIRDYVNFEKYETFIIDFFPAIKMFELILHQIGNGTESLKNEFDKKWNTIIDISILFGFFYKRHKKINCTLVTEDKNMRKKLIENGLENNLLNLSEFEKIYEHY